MGVPVKFSPNDALGDVDTVHGDELLQLVQAAHVLDLAAELGAAIRRHGRQRDTCKTTDSIRDTSTFCNSNETNEHLSSAKPWTKHLRSSIVCAN